MRSITTRLLQGVSDALFATSERINRYLRADEPVRAIGARVKTPLVVEDGIEAATNPSRGIVITTFSQRFYSDCLPLVRKLRDVGVLEPIYCVINGDWRNPFDIDLRQSFLQELSRISACFPICLGSPHGMASMWNTGIRLCDTDLTLVLNDDVTVRPSSTSDAIEELFQQTFAKGLVTLNQSFGHFAISRDCLLRVGWFDERFVAISHEDGDYAWRFIEAYGVPHHNLETPGLHNRVAKSGYEFAGSPKHKGSYLNDAFLLKKYRFGVGSIRGIFGEPAERILDEVPNYPLDTWKHELVPRYMNHSQEAVLAKLHEMLYGVD
jgi:hypothetical protein